LTFPNSIPRCLPEPLFSTKGLSEGSNCSQAGSRPCSVIGRRKFQIHCWTGRCRYTNSEQHLLTSRCLISKWDSQP